MTASSIESTVKSLGNHVNVALHICGGGVPGLIAGEPEVSRLASLVGERGGRIQLNFNAKRGTVNTPDLRRTIEKLAPMRVITQHNRNNAYLWSEIPLQNHQSLFDSSGGNGVKCKVWPNPLPSDCGYAGGLGPGTMADDLDAIATVAQDREIWIDMEGRLRVEHDGSDRLCLDLCEQVLNETSEWIVAYQ